MGPLAGYRIVELAGIGPGPMCGMLLAELGADVLSIDRIESAGLGTSARMPAHFQLLRRSRRSVAVDLKNPEGQQLVLRLVERADALIEGFRPGVTERLGLGPEDCAARNQKLVYGRVTGWGQHGPLSQAAGHDLNYIALTGALHSIGRQGQPPTPPLNLVGDFGGGALYLALGVVAAILEAQKSGKGQTVDAAMIDGAASLMTAAYAMHAAGITNNNRGENILDSGEHFYEVYETSDSKYVALAAIEPKFYAQLLELTGIAAESLPQHVDGADKAVVKSRLAEVIKSKTRQQWCDLLEGSDCCFAPVLDMNEAPGHPHNQERQTFVEIDGVVQPGAAPRFSRTPAEIRSPPTTPGAQTEEGLIDWGFTKAEIEGLVASDAIGIPVQH
jgi:alpha-methylacyl-CoA racemase